MQNYQDLTDTAPIQRGNIGIQFFSAPTPAALEAKINRYVASILLLQPEASLIDVALTAGGEGSIVGCKIIITQFVPQPPAVINYPGLEDVVFKVFVAPDDLTLAALLNAYLLPLATDTPLYLYDVAAGGAGNVWYSILVHEEQGG